MELVSIRRAAALFYVQVAAMNPRRKPIERRLTAALIERYAFLNFPQTLADFQPPDGGVAFGSGVWNDIGIDEVKIFENGFLVATGESTDRAEEVFWDMMALWTQHGAIFTPDMVTQTTYVSQITVRTDANLDSLNAALVAAVGDFFESPTGTFGIGFFTAGNPNTAPVRIERLVGQPLSENQYFTQTPLPTKRHLEFLEAYERVLLPR